MRFGTFCRQYNGGSSGYGLGKQSVPVDQLEAEGLQWASEVMEKESTCYSLP